MGAAQGDCEQAVLLSRSCRFGAVTLFLRLGLPCCHAVRAVMLRFVHRQKVGSAAHSAYRSGYLRCSVGSDLSFRTDKRVPVRGLANRSAVHPAPVRQPYRVAERRNI